MEKFDNIPLVAIDIGTTKVCVLVANPMSNITFEIIGFGKAPSLGLQKGVVVDMEKTTYAIKQAVEEASIMAGISITHATIGVSGSHIQAISSHGMVPIKHKIITQFDIDAVLQAAQSIQVPPGKTILHVLPKYFTVDGSERINNPLGMSGVRLEVTVHIIIGAVSAVQNLVQCCMQAGVHVQDIVLEHIASAYAVLSPDEKYLGTAMLDIGGGTSDFSLFYHNAVTYTNVIPIAGNHFTNDVAMGLRIPIHVAEDLKKQIGSVKIQDAYQDEYCVVNSLDTVNTEKKLVKDLHTILYWRAYELLQLLNKMIKTQHLSDNMHMGLVLTGGSVMLHGFDDLAQEILKVPVRIGKPLIRQAFTYALDDPMYATAYGLLLYAHAKSNTMSMQRLSTSWWGQISVRMKNWITDIF